MSKAVYAGTFDPITNGHVDIIARGALLFDELIVAISSHSRKAPLFGLAKRVKMAESVCGKFSNVTVVPFEGLLVDFVHAQNAQVILRGLRAVSDFDYEFQMAGTNRKLADDIETIFLPASENVAYISSTMVRDVIQNQGDVSKFVPAKILEQI